jgi:hypothetical protein
MAIRKSSSSGTPFGNTESRPPNPLVGQTYYNGELGYLEIYTASGWIPATGANDFSLNLSGVNTVITFNQSYSSGSYSIVSFGNDTTLDIYAYASDGSLAGYTNTKSFTASQRFNKMVILGGTSLDVISFSYKTTYATTSSTSDITAGPYVTSVTPSGVPNQNDTITVTGGNFASNAAVSFTGTGYSATAAKSVVRSSSTSLVVTRPDNLPVSGSPYSITVTNPSVLNQPTGSNVHVFSGITAGVVPVWQTSATINSTFYANASGTLTLSATDADGSSTITYSYVSGSLPTGLSFDSSTGVISGTATVVAQSTTYTLRATDSGGNTADRTFTITVGSPTVSGGTLASDATYYYRTFTGTNNLVVSNAPVSADILVIAGGGGGGNNRGGGGGAGGVLYTASQTLAPATYTCSVAGGGSAYTNGGSSSFIGGSVSLTGIGGGRGADDSQQFGSAGGSGGGSWAYSTTAGGAGTVGPPRQGFNGGAGGNSNGAGGGGGAAAVGGNGTSNGGNGGAATSAYSTWATATSTGVSGAYAGGGGGGKDSNNASAGSGGGGGAGRGNYGSQTGGSSATANTGSGGGGGGGTTGVSSAPSGASGGGGSGIVIVRYTKASVGG